MRISDWSSDVCSSDLVAVRRRGLDALADALDTALAAPPPEPAGLSEASTVAEADAHDPANLRALQREARAMAATATLSESGSRRWSHAADKVTLHPVIGPILLAAIMFRSEEHTSELQSLMRLSYAVFCLKKKKPTIISYKT